MSCRERFEEFFQDLSLAVPTLQDYEMIDWVILSLWGYAVLWPSKSREHTLFLFSIVDLLWGVYDLSIAEYAQSIPFLFGFFLIARGYLKSREGMIQ